MNLVDVDGLKIVSEGKKQGVKFVWADITNAPTVEAIPVEWLRKVRNDDKLTLDDVETIDLLLTWGQKEQEAR